MNRLAGALVTLTLVVGGMPAAAQQAGDATRMESTWLRAPTVQFDPFQDVFRQRSGLTFTAGALGENSAFNASDIGAAIFLADRDSFRAGEMIDAMGIIPEGEGLKGNFGANGGATFNLKISDLTIALSGTTGGSGGFILDDQAVSLLRDGNVAVQEFSLGDSEGIALGTAQIGGHALLQLGPYLGESGPKLFLGAGFRSVRPVYYGRVFSTIANGGRIALSGDSIVANLGLEVHETSSDDFSFGELKNRMTQSAFGSGSALDFLARAEWGAPKVAIELMVANLGTVNLRGVERRTANVDIAVTTLDSLFSVLDRRKSGPAGDTLAFVVQDTSKINVDLSRLTRFSADYGLHRALQLHASVTSIGGDFARPRTTELGATVRLLNWFPLRAGLMMMDGRGMGFTSGLGIETGHFVLRLDAASLGGFMREAKGVGAQFQLGFYF